MRLLRIVYRDRFFLLIILMAAILRFNNLTFGFPALYLSNDEASLHFSALNMLAHKTIFTTGNYGPLGAYIQIPFIILSFLVMLLDGYVKNIVEFKLLIASHEGYFLFIPRILSALFSILSIFVVYKLSLLIFNDKKSALWSSFLFAVSFNLVHVSHLARSWSEAIFFTLLSCYFILKSTKYTQSEAKNVILSFILLAIAFGFHQISGIVVLLIILIKKFSLKSIPATFKKIWKGLAVWFVLIVIFNYFSLGSGIFSVPINKHVLLINLPEHLDKVNDFTSYFFKIQFIKKTLLDLIKTDFVLILFFLIFFLRNLKRGAIFTSFFIFIAINYLLIVTIFPPFLRYFLLSISIFPIFSGYQLNVFIKQNKFLAILLILFSLFLPSYWNLLIVRKSTYSLAQEWIEANVSNKSYLAATQRRSSSYVPSTEVSQMIRNLNSGYYEGASKIIKNSYPDNVRNVIYLGEFKKTTKYENLVLAMKYFPITYVIDSYLGSYDRLSNYNNPKLKLIAHFSPTGNVTSNVKIPELFFDAPYIFPLFKLDKPGPYFDIFRIE